MRHEQKEKIVCWIWRAARGMVAGCCEAREGLEKIFRCVGINILTNEQGGSKFSRKY